MTNTQYNYSKDYEPENTTSLNPLNLIYIIFAVIWEPLQMIIKIDGKGRFLLIFTIWIFLYNLVKRPKCRSLLFSFPLVCWLFWVIYATINMSLKMPHIKDFNLIYYSINGLLCPKVALLISCYEYIYNRNALLKVLLVSFLFYVFIGYFILDVSYAHTGEDINTAFSVGNKLSLNAIWLIFVSALLYKHNEIRLPSFAFFVALSFYIVIVTATRKAFGAGLILLFFSLWGFFKMNTKGILSLAFALLFLNFAIDHFMTSSVLAERFSEGFEETELIEADAFPLLKYMGDRTIMYVLGWELFMQNPITGIGILNFMEKADFPYRLHTEYMVQLTENGIIGFSLFILFFICILYIVFSTVFHKSSRNEGLIMMGCVVTILFISFTAWTYDMPYYFICLGIVIGYCMRPQYEKTEETEEDFEECEYEEVSNM